jgi:hypothetical protein
MSWRNGLPSTFYSCPRASIAARTFGGDIGNSVSRVTSNSICSRRPAVRQPGLCRTALNGLRKQQFWTTSINCCYPAIGPYRPVALAHEAGRRKLTAAVPALEALCRRFSGFGIRRLLPEQAAALSARPARSACQRFPHIGETDCVAGHIGLELRCAKCRFISLCTPFRLLAGQTIAPMGNYEGGSQSDFNDIRVRCFVLPGAPYKSTT